MIYLLETYDTNEVLVKQCIIHCPATEFEGLFETCKRMFGTFRLTKFAEYTFGASDGGLAFYSEAKNRSNKISQGRHPRLVENIAAATVRNLK
jgi:hypothetical protein